MEFNYLDSDIDLFWSQMDCTHMEVTYLASMEHPNGSLTILRILPELFCYIVCIVQTFCPGLFPIHSQQII